MRWYSIVGGIVLTLSGMAGGLLGLSATPSETPHESPYKAPVSLAVISPVSGATESAITVDDTLLRGLEADAWAAEMAATEAARVAEEARIAHEVAEVSRWTPLAICEMAGNWAYVGSRFSGGLGFYNGTWDAWGGREFADNAGRATPYQQTIVATRVRDAVGRGAWDGCSWAVP